MEHGALCRVCFREAERVVGIAYSSSTSIGPTPVKVSFRTPPQRKRTRASPCAKVYVTRFTNQLLFPATAHSLTVRCAGFLGSNCEGRGRIISSPPWPSPQMPRCHQARGRRPAHASLNDPSLQGQCLPPHRPTTCLLTTGDLRLQKVWSAYATSLRWLGSRRWPRSHQRPWQRCAAAWHWPLRPTWPSRSHEQMLYGQ